MGAGMKTKMRRFGQIRRFIWLLVLVGALPLSSYAAQTAQSANTSELKLIPMPREVHAGDAVLLNRGLAVSVPGKDAEDEFAAQDLLKKVAAEGVPESKGDDAFRVTLLRTGTAEANKFLNETGQKFDAPMHDEGYVLVVRPHEAYVVGATASGVFYGVQTLKQMVTGRGASAKVQTAVIRDWPAMKYRGIDDDLSRGPFPTLAFQKHQIQVFAAFKINIYSPYFEHTLAYQNNPLPAPPNSAMSPADVAELVQFAKQYHITVVPEQEAFGHLHHVLTWEKYSALAETPHGNVLAPGQPGSIDLIKSWFGEIAKEFPSPFIHIGADETFDLGTGQTKTDVQKRGLGPVYADFLTQIDEALKPLHRKLLFWGDIATSNPSLVQYLPKDMIAVPWVYWHQDSYDKDILPFKKEGIETWVAPGDANWNLVYPDANVAFDNIQGFVADGQRLGSTGVLTTVWNDDGEGLFSMDWYGLMFGAAAGWEPAPASIAQYQHSFGSVFFGDSSGKTDQALQELLTAYKILGTAHIGDISDRTFWQDPWSTAGQKMADKMRPVSHDARLHAERALTLLYEVRKENPDLREQSALDAIELGARRIDFAIQKFQLSDEMAAAYAEAYAKQGDASHRSATSEILSSISSMNGRCQDLRDGYSLIKNLYKKVWLSQNSPYWIDNVLVRYDLRIQLWQQRGEKVDEVHQQWWDTHTLPIAGELGIPPAPATLNPALMPLGRMDTDWWAKRHEAVLARMKQGNVDLLLIGDSITNNYDKTSPPNPANQNFHPVWEQFYGDRHAVNLGFSGDTTAHVLWRFQNGELNGISPKAAVVMIGTNNLGYYPQLTAEEDATSIEAVVDELHKRLPQTKVLLLGVLPRGGSPLWKTQIPAINQLLATQYAGSDFVTFKDISNVFMKNGEVNTSLYYDPTFTPPADALHPTAEGQRKMAEAIEPVVAKLLGDKPKN